MGNDVSFHFLFFFDLKIKFFFSNFFSQRWNDPINYEELLLLPENQRKFINNNEKGFCRNFKRGTGYLFSENAVKKFLRKNSIDFIIRAHEVFADGFNFNSQGKVITIFSSSGYSIPSNKASILLISNNKIRIIRT